MTSRSAALLLILTLTALLGIPLSACTSETIEVTRIKIMERRVIERVPVTVEVTRIHRVIVTPTPTPRGSGRPSSSPTPGSSPTAQSPTPTPTSPQPAAGATEAPVPTSRRLGVEIMAAIRDTEQTLLSLVQALNSNPLPVDQTIELYNDLQIAATFTLPTGETELQSIYLRYREQVDYALGQANDLYNHLLKIQSGEADQTEVSPIHLALARDSVSAGTSAVQGLLRELEDFLVSQP